MTNQEAIDNIKYFLDEHCSDEEVWKSINCLVDLVDRATPKRLKCEDAENGWFICPVCGEIYEEGLNNWKDSYCPHCGQALDWSEDEDRKG